MKKALSAATAATAAVIALTLAACSTSTSANSSAPAFGDCKITGEAGSIKLKTVKPDTLTVATVLPNPGWWNGTSPDSIKSGFEYCMAAGIAQRAGLKSIEIKNLAWDQYISGTATGYDLGIAATTVTDKRKQIFDFSRPYFHSNMSVAVKNGANITADNIRDAKIGVLQGNAGATWVAEVLRPKTPAATFQQGTDMFTALSSGQVDAVVTDTALNLTYVKQSAGTLVVAGQYEFDQGYGVLTPLHSANTAAVDKAVGAMDSDGTIKALTSKYLQPLFGVDPNTIPMWSIK